MFQHSQGEEKGQEIENLFEKITNENLPKLVKEIDIQVQGAQRVPNKMDAKRPTPRHTIIKMPKVKNKERILKAAREKQLVTYRGVPIRQQLISLRKLCRLEWMKLRIRSMIWNTRKQNTTNENNQKKKESKKMIL